MNKTKICPLGFHSNIDSECDCGKKVNTPICTCEQRKSELDPFHTKDCAIMIELAKTRPICTCLEEGRGLILCDDDKICNHCYKFFPHENNILPGIESSEYNFEDAPLYTDMKNTSENQRNSKRAPHLRDSF